MNTACGPQTYTLGEFQEKGRIFEESMAGNFSSFIKDFGKKKPTLICTSKKCNEF